MTILLIAGRALKNADDHIRRYCGLPWSGGAGETWAYRYFDDIPDPDPTRVGPVDVLTAAALHPGLHHTDLTWFWDHHGHLESALAALPTDIDLGQVTPDQLRAVQNLPELVGPGAPGLSLLSKVLHRKRPRLVPMLDRAVLDRYRPLLSSRSPDAWPALVQALHDDLGHADNIGALNTISQSLHVDLSVVPGPLRLVDISIWMQPRVKSRPTSTGVVAIRNRSSHA